MNVERDTDRQLRAWASEGVDRAPERFVWAALDEIEQIQQRTPWLTRLDGLATRLGPAAALVGAAAVILVAIAIITRVVSPNLGVGSPRDFVIADLPGIVLFDDTKPRSWTLDNLVSNPWEVSVYPIRSMTGEEIDVLPEPAGLIAGRYTNFSGPDSAFVSWATLFATDGHASDALTFYEREMETEDAWGLGPGEPIAFGDGGRLFTGVTTAFLGQPTGDDPIGAQIYLWRDGNLLLAVGGYFDYDAAELRAVAEAVAARADAASTVR
jgi:hypothetical protein